MEFLTLSFHHPAAIFFEALLLLGAAAVFWYASQGRFTESLLLLMWAHAALLAGRNIPIFAIVAAPLVAGSGAGTGWRGCRSWNVAGVAARARGARFNQIAAETGETDASAALAPGQRGRRCAGGGPAVRPRAAQAVPRGIRSAKRIPAAAVETLRGDPSARIFTNDQWGDYLI